MNMTQLNLKEHKRIERQKQASRINLLISTCIIIVLMLVIGSAARADQCPSFTDEQQAVLQQAAMLAAPHDWSYTMMAIVWRESFWGDEVRRHNPGDADGGSWGVTQMRVTTALWLVGWDDTEGTREVMRNMLIECDTCAIELSLHYLMGHINVRGWRAGIARYNGAGERAERYADAVVARVRVLQRCLP